MKINLKFLLKDLTLDTVFTIFGVRLKTNIKGVQNESTEI